MLTEWLAPGVLIVGRSIETSVARAFSHPRPSPFGDFKLAFANLETKQTAKVVAYRRWHLLGLDCKVHAPVEMYESPRNACTTQSGLYCLDPVRTGRTVAARNSCHFHEQGVRPDHSVTRVAPTFHPKVESSFSHYFTSLFSVIRSGNFFTVPSHP